MAAFLSALKVFDGIAPPYRSTVLLELHKIDGKPVIYLLYRNDTTRDAYSLQIPGKYSMLLFKSVVECKTEENDQCLKFAN